MLGEIRYALRLLASTPAFTTIAVLTLSIGIGSVAVVFSAINALLLKPLPYVQHEDRIVALTMRNPSLGPNHQDFMVSLADLRDLERGLTTSEGAYHYAADLTVILTGGDTPLRFLGTQVAPHTFAVLGVRPLLGRSFTAADGAAAAPPVALLGHHVWQSRFGGDPALVGTTVTLNDVPVTVVGIMPPGWRFPERSDVWLPLRADDAKATIGRGDYWLRAGLRLKPGVTLAAAQAEVDAVMARLAVAYPETNDGVTIRLRPFRAPVVADTQHLTWLLLGAAVFIFLIACANVAHLQLARVATRAPEIGLRFALGAGRPRLMRQLLTENLVLALLSGVGAAIFALWAVDWMVAAIPIDLPFWMDFAPDAGVVALVFALACVASLLFGVVPAWRISRPGAMQHLRAGDRTLIDRSVRGTRLRHALVIGEVALALVLLVGAGLMMRSFRHLRGLPTGFTPAEVMTFRVGIPDTMARDGTIVPRFFGDLIDRLRVLPDVKAAAATNQLPGTGDARAQVDWKDAAGNHLVDAAMLPSIRTVTPDYFAALRIPVLHGRDFTRADRADAPPVAIVDATFARRCFGSVRAALGQRVHVTPKYHAEPTWRQIVGVVGPVRHQLGAVGWSPTLYLPHAQQADNFMSIVLRTDGDPLALLAAARAEVLAVHKDIPTYDELSLARVILRSHGVWTQLFFSRLFTASALIALFLACIGIYGVMSFHVTQLRHEIGVRMALGAPGREVVRDVIRRGLRLVALGLGAGVVAAAVLSNLLTGVLHGISPHDPPTFAVVPLLLAAVALIACYVPSRRATRIDPVLAIRGE